MKGRAEDARSLGGDATVMCVGFKFEERWKDE
jgi:hypothetical protein